MKRITEIYVGMLCYYVVMTPFYMEILCKVVAYNTVTKRAQVNIIGSGLIWVDIDDLYIVHEQVVKLS